MTNSNLLVGSGNYIDKAKLKLAKNYLLDNCCFTVVNLSFTQVTGITLGSGSVPIHGKTFSILL